MALRSLVNVIFLTDTLVSYHQKKTDINGSAIAMLRFDEMVFDYISILNDDIEELLLDDLKYNLQEYSSFPPFFLHQIILWDVAARFCSTYNYCNACEKTRRAVDMMKYKLPERIRSIAKLAAFKCRIGNPREFIATGRDEQYGYVFNMDIVSELQVEKQKILLDVLVKELEYDNLVKCLVGAQGTQRSMPYQFTWEDRNGERHDYRENITEKVTINLSSVNVLSSPWNKDKGNSFYRLVKDIRAEGFRYDKGNHMGIYIPELNMLYVQDGYHSLAAAGYLGTGIMQAEVFHLSGLFDYYTVPNEREPVLRNKYTQRDEFLPSTRWTILFALAQRIAENERKLDERSYMVECDIYVSLTQQIRTERYVCYRYSSETNRRDEESCIAELIWQAMAEHTLSEQFIVQVKAFDNGVLERWYAYSIIPEVAFSGGNVIDRTRSSYRKISRSYSSKLTAYVVDGLLQTAAENSILDTAEYILKKRGFMPASKLQKLCYYAQAWSLTQYGSPLFYEDFQAWTDGPVCLELYAWTENAWSETMLTELTMPVPDNNSRLTTEQQRTIDEILSGYGSLSSACLTKRCCDEGPWREAKDESTAANPITICKESLAGHYRRLL